MRLTFSIKSSVLAICILLWSNYIYSQDKPILSGNIEANYNVFMRDSLIGAVNIPQYDRQLTGGEAWVNLNYAYQGFNLGLRFDVFNNSNLLNPTDSYTDQGIGYWAISKKVDKLDVTAGYIYDQIGSGIIYRAWESRPLLIDNALVGARLTYDLGENWQAKAFAGRQKFLFDVYSGNVKGGSIDGFISMGSEESPWSLSPGVGFVNRTLSDQSMNLIIDNIRTYLPEDRDVPVYNVYLASLYNTLSYKSITWYVEAAYKSPEVFFDPFDTKTSINGSETFGRFRKAAGSVLYSSLSFAKNKLGVTLEAKRTENFNFRIDPNLTLNRGLITFIPPMNRVNTYRLTARYAPATQDLSELAFQADVRYRFNKSWSALVNYSNISRLDGEDLYNELFTEIVYKYKRKWQLSGGLQLQTYNQEIYETKPEVPLVKTVTPYLDFLYKIDRKKSIRFETQYMDTDQDFGSWWFGLVEIGLAPKWIFETSLMYNVSPGPNAPKDPETGEKVAIAYPTFGVVYTKSSNRFQLRYVKQVEGIVCSGGICRLEPAFSGVKFSMSSNF